ncbi:histidine kinase [Isoptericola sp. F-RaC21]|uniref:sensor histidine kinase n=1 Tax=Isoptericola sp. F-RaC21 TaxID=3141452 RepID=UPI00315C20D6
MPATSAPARGQRLRAALGRWRTLQPTARDGLLAAALAALALVPTLSAIGVELGDLPSRPPDVLAVVLVLGQCLPLAARRRRPAACLAVVGAAFALHEALSYPPTFASVGLYVAVYSAAAHLARSRGRVAALATVAYAGLAVALAALGSPNRLPAFLAFYLVLAVVWAGGAGVRRWRAEEVEHRRLAAAAATAQERARIARELHDVVTHHVTAMVVQADATQYLLPARPDRAGEGLEAISDTGRRALTELRYLLGALEATGEPETAERAPAPGRVSHLVEQARRSGQPVEWTEDGDARPRPDAVELAAYRVVQESLTNALKHAAGRPTAVRVRHFDDRLEVEVTTQGPGVPGAPAVPSGGRGLAGLRERVRVLDGDLDAGPTPDGGFAVRALIPTDPTRSRP